MGSGKSVSLKLSGGNMDVDSKTVTSVVFLKYSLIWKPLSLPYVDTKRCCKKVLRSADLNDQERLSYVVERSQVGVQAPTIMSKDSSDRILTFLDAQHLILQNGQGHSFSMVVVDNDGEMNFVSSAAVLLVRNTVWATSVCHVQNLKFPPVQQRELYSVLCNSIWEKNLKKNWYMYMYNWITLLGTWN